MSPATSIALAAVAMAMLTAAVALRMVRVRIREMREKRIPPQQVATSVQVVARLQSVQASDNYRNLFEMPVLFYALCALVLATGHASTLFAAGAWLYVALRCAHSLIQCTYNKVMHRFAVFLASFVVLVVLWVALGAALLR